jgi:hypothetical protein
MVLPIDVYVRAGAALGAGSRALARIGDHTLWSRPGA